MAKNIKVFFEMISYNVNVAYKAAVLDQVGVFNSYP